MYKTLYAIANFADAYYKYYLAIAEKALENIEQANKLFEYIIENGGTLPIVNLAKLQKSDN